jgi:hypothetical protein
VLQWKEALIEMCWSRARELGKPVVARDW